MMTKDLTMKNIFHISVIVLLFYTSSFSGESETNAKHIAELLPGAYSTSQQAVNDSYFLDLQLHIVHIDNQADSIGYWFYLETAFTADSLRPYKQQVYRLLPYQLGMVKLLEYSIPNKEKYVTAWLNPAILNNIINDSLVLKTNCAIVIKELDNIFVGSTTGEGCLSTLRGAVFEATEIEISKKEFYIWNRGYNHKKEQVWGTKESGYSFLKKK